MSAYPAIMQIVFKNNSAMQALHFEDAEQGRAVCAQIFEAMRKIAQVADTPAVQAAAASFVFPHSVGMMLLRPADVAAIYFQDGSEEIAERLRSIKARQDALEKFINAEQPTPPGDLSAALLVEGIAAQCYMASLPKLDTPSFWYEIPEEAKDNYRNIARAKLVDKFSKGDGV